MKTIALLFHIFKNYMARSKNIFIIFIISYILLSFVIIFFYGAFFPYITQRKSQELTECRYIINFNNKIPYEQLDFFYENEQIRNNRHFEVETYLEGEELFHIYSVFSPGYDVILMEKQSGRLHFTEEEIEAAEKVAIVTPDMGELGDTITVDPIGELKIIGVMNTLRVGGVYIPCSLFRKCGLPVFTMKFVVQNRLDLYEIKELEDFLYGNENVAYVQGPAPTMNTIINNTAGWLISFFILLLIVFIMFLFFAQYMSEKNKKIYAAFGVLGENKANILFLLILERGITILLSMGIAAILHLLARGKLHSILHLAACNMLISDYLVVILLSFFAAILIAIPYAITFLFRRYTILLKQSE